MFRAETVEQYKIYNFLCNKFEIDLLKIEKVNRNTLKVVDTENSILYFSYSSSKKEVVWSESLLC